MNLSIKTFDKEESEEYFTPPQSPNCNEDHGLKSNKED
jgi:hypothetical protein